MRRIVAPPPVKDENGLFFNPSPDKPFPEQDAFINDTAQFISVQCSRRAGKTSGLARRFFNTMEKHPGATCYYLALTKESARNIMWPVIEELNSSKGLGLKLIESTLTVKHRNGAKLKLLGADMKNFIKRIKGVKSPGIGVDEAQDFGDHLQTLIDDVLTPTIADYEDSWLAVTGTPGAVPSGYFFDVTEGHKYGFSLHKWTLFNNPYMPFPHQFVQRLKEKRQWPDNYPTLLREWYNQWILDVNSLWIRYNDKINHYSELPKEKMTYVMGVDLGFKDADAIAILGWTQYSPSIYLVEELVTPKQGITELATQIKRLQAKYSVTKIVMDEGALGKKIGEEIRRRHHIPVTAADKQRKQEAVEFLNDSLHIGQFFARNDSQFVKDSYLIQINWEKTTPTKIVLKEAKHSDIIDAALYAFRESPAYANRVELKKEEQVVGSKEWSKKQEDQMFDVAMKHFQEKEEQDKVMESLTNDIFRND